MRYKDPIQCAGHTLLEAVRQEALAVSPQHNGQFYALHIRRGDFQFKVSYEYCMKFNKCHIKSVVFILTNRIHYIY